MSYPEQKHQIEVVGKDIPPDEPLFLLRSQDEYAPAAVEAYAQELMAASHRARDADDREGALELWALANDAERFAIGMHHWQRSHPDRVKRPD